MKKLVYLFVTLLSGVAQYTWAQEVLTNQNIVAMNQAKVSRSVMIDKIRTGSNKFDLTTIGLLSLKMGDVPDALIDAMLSVTPQRDVLRNNDVIRLYEGGVSRSIITKKIQSSAADFDLSPDGLIQLKSAKVPDGLVKIMMNPTPVLPSATHKDPVISVTSKKEKMVAAAAPAHPDNLPAPSSVSFPETGIYYEEYKGNISYQQLDPTTTNMTKSGSVGESILNRYTRGYSGSTQRVGLANKTANFVIDDSRPVFYFVFGQTRKQMDDVAENSFSGVASPNEFVLIKANSSGRGRQIEIGRQSAVTSESGVRGTTIPFRYKKIAAGLYRVYFEQDVPAGEYLFFYNKGSEQGSSVKVYDFSLRSNNK